MNRLVAAAAGLAVSAAAHTATAQTFTWANPAGGTWNTDGNWDMTGFPNVFGESALIDLPGTYSVTLSVGGIRNLDLLDLANPDTTLVLNTGASINFDALNNNGLIRVNPTGFGSNSVMTATTTTTVTGTGILELSGGTDDAQLNTDTAVTLTNSATHTIRGTGQVNADLINNGLVQAFNTGLGNILEIQDEDKVNNGTFASNASAVLQIEQITIDQTGGGVIDAVNGVVQFSSGADTTILGGTITATAGGTVTRQVGTLSLDNTIIDTDITIDPAGTIRSLGDLFVNNGTIFINLTGFGSNGIVQFDADALATGTGTLLLGGGFDDSQINTEPGATLTQDNTHTIAGAGHLNAALINNGTVEATNTGLANILEVQAENKTNNATFASNASAVLQIEDLTITQGIAGVIDARDGTVSFTGTNTIDGGRIDASLGGPVNRQVGTTTLVNTTIDADINMVSGGNINLEGAATTNNGTITVNLTGFGTNSVVAVPNTHELNGTGEILLGGGSDDSQVTTDADNNAVLTHAATHTVRGTGIINARIDNFGTIRAENTGLGNTLEVDGQTIRNIGPDAVIEADDLAALNIRTLTIEDGRIDTNGGTINFVTNQTPTIIGATIDNTNGGTVVRFPGTTTFSGVTSNATIDIQSGGAIDLDGNGLINNSTIFVNNTGFGTDSFLHFASSTLLNGTGTVDLGGGLGDSQITVAENETAVIGAGQTIVGTGDMTGDFIFEGTLAPDAGFTGTPIGRIDARGPGIELTSTANLDFNVNSGTSFDRINRPDNDAPIHLAGTLTITADPAGSYILGQELPIIEQGGPITGSFDSNNVSSVFINDDLALRLVQRDDEVVLRVINFDCPADIIAPLDVLDLSDVDNFIALFAANDPVVDIAFPFGIVDLTDIDLFIQLFTQGCL